MKCAFLEAIGRADGPRVPQLAMLFLVRRAMRLRGELGPYPPTPRQHALESAALSYPLPGDGVERTRMLIAARTQGLLIGEPPILTHTGNARLDPYDQEML